MTTTPESALRRPARLPADVLCIGEAMVMLGADEGSLSESDVARLYIAGAESNVACGLAHLGQSVEWFGRVGSDPFGDRIRRSLDRRNVDTRNVITDFENNTGIYFKEWAGEQSAIYYYRAGSAAAHLTVPDFDDLELETRRLCHVSGITPALSAQCDEAMGNLLLERDRGELIVSFDVNHRSQLWSVEIAAPRILQLARGADIVIVGRDEAQSLWGTATADEVRDLFIGSPMVVVKDAEFGASCYFGEETVFVPALKVEVLEPIGAGDAFAAGFLSAWLDGEDPASCLRLGHVMAAHVLRSVGDTPDLPPRAELLALAGLDDEAWSSAYLAGAEQERASAIESVAVPSSTSTCTSVTVENASKGAIT